MVSCCLIDLYIEFEVIIIGVGVLEVFFVFYLILYGIRMVFVDEQNVDNRLKDFLRIF